MTPARQALAEAAAAERARVSHPRREYRCSTGPAPPEAITELVTAVLGAAGDIHEELPPWAELDPDERRRGVADFRAAGYSYRAIARYYDVSPRTIRNWAPKTATVQQHTGQHPPKESPYAEG